MTDRLPHTVIACDRAVRDVYLDPADVARLERVATWEWVHVEGGREFGANRDSEAREAVRARLVGAEPPVRCHPLRSAGPGLRYRNKLELSFGVKRYLSAEELATDAPLGGRFLGMHAPGRFDRIADAPRCELASEAMKQFTKQGLEIRLGAKVSAAKVAGKAVKVSYTLCLGGLSFFLFILLTAVLGPLLTPYDPMASDTTAWMTSSRPVPRTA